MIIRLIERTVLTHLPVQKKRGLHQYKFVINGEWWVEPSNPFKELSFSIGDAIGSRNCLLKIDPDMEIISL